MTKQIFSALKVVALALVFSLGLSYVYAWTAPTTTPPGGNVSAPINTGNTAQVMAGGLTVNTATSTKDIVVNGITLGMGGSNVSSNTVTGQGSLGANTTGYNNTANGVGTLLVNTTGSGNTAIGHQALWRNTAGGTNTANGLYSLQLNTTGSENTANGVGALSSNVSGGRNVAIGNSALSMNTTGSSATALGYKADVASGALTNATAIGANAKVSASNEIQLGSTAVTAVRTSGGIYAPSIQLSTGAALNKVLASDASGNASWVFGGLGYKQSWQSVAWVNNTWYYNTSDQPIMVRAQIITPGNNSGCGDYAYLWQQNASGVYGPTHVVSIGCTMGNWWGEISAVIEPRGSYLPRCGSDITAPACSMGLWELK